MKLLSFIAFILLTLQGNAQHKNLPLNELINYQFQRELLQHDTLAHGSFRPLREDGFGIKHTALVQVDSGKYYYGLTQKLYKEHLLFVEGKDYFLAIDPLFNFRIGNDIADTLRLMTRNTRGFRVQGDIGDKVSFETSFYENQSKFPNYVPGYRSQSEVVIPGEGRVKGTKNNGLDYGYAMGYVSYSPNKQLNFQIGNGKNFVGNGYRSMLLSDFSFNYPYLKFNYTTKNGKFNYNAIYASMQTLLRLPAAETPETTFKEKFGKFHYLTYKPNSKLEIGLFEGVLYKQYEDGKGTVPVHFSAYFPIILSGLAFNGFESENNVVLGLNASYAFNSKLQAYGQLAIDNPMEAKLGWQFGIKAFDLFEVENLYVQLEYNQALQNTYATDVNDRQYYRHFNTEIAHPLGAGFQEFVGIFNYEYDRFYAQLKINSSFSKQQPNGRGTDIAIGDLEDNSSVVLIEDEIHQKQFQDFQIGYRFNLKTNMTVLAGVRNRVYSSPNEVTNSAFIYVGWRTNLNNLYYDY